MYPTLAAPHRERLAGRNPEEVHPGVGAFRGELCPREPTGRKLVPAIGQVFSAEDAEAQHFRRREFRTEVRVKIAADGCNENVPITLLHPVIDDDGSLLHREVPLFWVPWLGWLDTSSTTMPKIFQTCRILTDRGHVAELSNHGYHCQECPSNSDLPALANLVVVQ